MSPINIVASCDEAYAQHLGVMLRSLCETNPDEQFRVALARAYLHDPSIVIVEEPAGPIDEETRHLLDDTLARLSDGRTLILLPHHLATIRSCDQIIVLHDSRVEDVGPPAQLQTESKLYRHILYVHFNEYASG